LYFRYVVFCAREQKETDHTVDIDGAGEIVITCVSSPSESGKVEDAVQCNSFLKFPKGTTAEDLKARLEIHKESNEGKLTVEQLEKEKAKILAKLFPKEE